MKCSKCSSNIQACPTHLPQRYIAAHAIRQGAANEEAISAFNRHQRKFVDCLQIQVPQYVRLLASADGLAQQPVFLSGY
ncbi:hypothetical protein WJX77_003912 [Trebouxia sp. C0004]